MPTQSVSLNSLAKQLLPERIYKQLAASEVAKRLIRGSAWSIFGSATGRILTLMGMILLARILGQTAFGEFGMIQATLGVAGMMAGFGLGSTATRFIAQYSQTEPDRAGRIIVLVSLSSWTLVLVTNVIIVGACGPIARIALNAPHLQTALVWGTLLMTAMAIRGVQTGILAGLERFDAIAKLNVLEGITSLLGLVFLASFFGIEGGLLGLAFGSAVTWFIGRLTLKRMLSDRGIVVAQKGWWQERQILSRYSLPSFLASSVATPVLWYCMTLVANRPEGYDDLALYHAAYQWHGPVIFIPMILATVSTPVLVQLWESNHLLRFRSIFLLNAGFLLAISTAPVIIVAALSPWIMGFYGPEFRNGWLVLVLLIVAAPMHALDKISSSALLGMNRAWWALGINCLWGAILLVLASCMVPLFGAKGLAASFLITYSIIGVGSVVTVLVGSRWAAAERIGQ